MNVKILSHTHEPEKVIAMAGKLCYSPKTIDEIGENLTEENINKFVNMLVDLGHESPLEHISFTFGVEGISRACSMQLVRHRIASYSQQSQRYVDTINNFNYVIPSIVQEMGECAVERFERDMEQIRLTTERWHDRFLDFLDENKEFNRFGMSDKKIANENSRVFLPNATETKIVITMNLRTLINFVKKRSCNRAQEEINKMAWEMVKEIEKISPLLSSLLGAPCQFGKCPEGKMCCGKPYPKKIKGEK